MVKLISGSWWEGLQGKNPAIISWRYGNRVGKYLHYMTTRTEWTDNTVKVKKKILFRFISMCRFKFTENEQEAFWDIQWLT